MTRCESYPLCSGTIYFPTAPFSALAKQGIPGQNKEKQNYD